MSHDKVLELLRIVQSIGGENLGLKLQKWVEEASQPTIGDLVRPMIENCRLTARRLGKFVQVHVNGDQLRTRGAKETAIIESLIHVLRNSVVHGIEEDRESLGKPKNGRIDLVFTEEASALLIRFQDDGQGFSRKLWEDIAQRQLSLKAAEVSAMSLQDLVFRVAQSGYSTLKDLNLDAGRGIGLGGLIEQIQQLDGRIELHSEEGQGSRFDIQLPREPETPSLNLSKAG